jgi:hypothetical protein
MPSNVYASYKLNSEGCMNDKSSKRHLVLNPG